MEVKSKDTTKIHYEVSGNGPLIILLHGFGNDSSMWSTTGWIDLLKVKYTVVVIDLRGCGTSDKPDHISDYTIEKHLDDIEIVAKSIQKEPPILWGWSLGATISLLYGKYREACGVIACGTYFGKIFSDEYVCNRIKTLSDQNSIIRLSAFKRWPTVNPCEIKKPFLVYTGTNDGNVVKRLQAQGNEIMNAKGKLLIFDALDHIGLIRNKDRVKESIFPFLNSLKIT
jgi:dipeptidyl aminopeptidase/acylaminoacyl peptidase